MPKVHIEVPMPGWLHAPLRRVKRVLFKPQLLRPTIWGERHVEWAFISDRMPDGPGEALEFGCEHGYLSLLAATKGFHVVAMDLQPQIFPWQDPKVDFVLGDLLELDLPENRFDLVINCSSVEHVGLAGRYGITELDMDGDLRVMERLRAILKPNGMMLMTTPIGRDAVMAPWHRVYGAERLPRLLNGYSVEEEAYWVKNAADRWVSTDKASALDFIPLPGTTDAHTCAYALGCFRLRKPC